MRLRGGKVKYEVKLYIKRDSIDTCSKDVCLYSESE
jgi:hypothetical protein